MAMCVLTWEVLGFGLQYKKGQLGSLIEWIGGSIIISSNGVTARIAEAIVQDIRMLIKEFGLNLFTFLCLSLWAMHLIWVGGWSMLCMTHTCCSNQVSCVKFDCKYVLEIYFINFVMF